MYVIAGWNKDKHNCMFREDSLSSQPSGELIILEGTNALNFPKKGILLISITFNVTDKPIFTACFRELTYTCISINNTHVLCTQQYVMLMQVIPLHMIKICPVIIFF